MTERPQTTIYDLARELHLSPSTVSRALRDHPDVKSETKKKVVALAEEHKYLPDSIAQSLQKKRTKTIAVIVPEIKHYFFASVISGIEDVAYKAGYTILVTQSHESYEREVLNTNAMVSNRVAGILVSISQTTKCGEHFFSLIKRKIPIVFFDRVFDDIKASKVVVDDAEGAFKAVEHLINRGYNRIAHLAGPEYISIARERFNGYIKAHQKYNLPADKRLVIRGGLNEEDGIAGFRELMKLDKKPDAIFAVNDPVAIGAYMEIKKEHIRIPTDMALVGYSNNPIVSLVEPPLTTVEQPMITMGQKAASIIIDEIETNQPQPEKNIVLRTKLIVRKST